MNLSNVILQFFLIVLGCPSYSNGKGYAPGKQFEYKTKDLPQGVYQYSIWVQKIMIQKRVSSGFLSTWWGRQKISPYGKKNIISDRLLDNQIDKRRLQWQRSWIT